MIDFDQYSTTRHLSKGKPFTAFEKVHNLKPTDYLVCEGGLRTSGYFKSATNQKPIVSIIVAVFNGGAQLEETIVSVINQEYEQIELLIIDGGSTDGTVEMLKNYQNAINYWISEPDQGIADAFNKGVKIAQGDYINFQGAGDTLISNTVITEVMKNINSSVDMLVCGRIQRVADTNDKEVLYTSPRHFNLNFNKKSLLFRMSLPHQALFTNKRFFESYGLFDKNCIFAMDYEQLLRAYKNFPNVVMKDVLVSSWRAGGVGENRTLDIFKEYYRVKAMNNVAPRWILMGIYIWTLVKYFIKNFLTYLRLFKVDLN